MEWLLLLLCPIMMLFCMKGMHGKKHNHGSHSTESKNLHSIEQYQVKELINKVDLLTEQNKQLRDEVQALKSKNEVS